MPRPTICLRASTSGSSSWSRAGASEMTKTILGQRRFCNSRAMLLTNGSLLGMDNRYLGSKSVKGASWLATCGAGAGWRGSPCNGRVCCASRTPTRDISILKIRKPSLNQPQHDTKDHRGRNPEQKRSIRRFERPKQSPGRRHDEITVT